MFTLKVVLSTVLVAQSLLHGVQATGAFFPLYIYPGDSCSGWTTVFDSITANPNVHFTLAINPASGPGSSGSVPDTNYQACIQQALAIGSNVKIVGYVPTGFGTRSSSDVLADIATYFNWPTSYRPSGIFFDETTASSSNFNLYSTYYNQVKGDSSSATVILNPGTVVGDSRFFSIADFIVTAENFYNNFSFPGSLTINSTEPASKQIVILHDGPSTLPTSLIDQLIAGGIGSTFITNEPQADAYSVVPSYWEAFVEDLA